MNEGVTRFTLSVLQQLLQPSHAVHSMQLPSLFFLLLTCQNKWDQQPGRFNESTINPMCAVLKHRFLKDLALTKIDHPGGSCYLLSRLLYIMSRPICRTTTATQHLSIVVGFGSNMLELRSLPKPCHAGPAPLEASLMEARRGLEPP